MKLNAYEKKKKRILAAQSLLTVIGTGTVYAVTESLWTAGVFAVCMLGMLLLAWLLCRLSDMYISGAVNDLSRLCDNLTTLEETVIFPENEDNALSKLQNKVLKLVKILRKKNKTAEKNHENIKSLVSDISHQLKTPIANLKMYAELLDDDGITEVQRREYTEVIQLSVDRLHFLSESMIKISRLESGLIHLQPEVQSLHETVMMSVKDVFTKAKERKIELKYTGDNIETCHDRRWTAEAVFNLLDNAVKYSCQGKKIEIVLKQFGTFAAVEVADENVPIPEEEQSRIFTRFYRGSNSGKSEGIGVGLYLAREITVRQGGYMRLAVSEKGNVFSIVLPCR